MYVHCYYEASKVCYMTQFAILRIHFSFVPTFYSSFLNLCCSMLQIFPASPSIKFSYSLN